MKRLLFYLLVLAVSIGSWAQKFTPDGWEYSVSNGNATIKGTTQTSGTDLKIPSRVGGYPVTAIGDYALQNRTGFTGSLIIPESVTTIGNFAFHNCANLKAVTIPEGVTTIGEYAFWGCKNLTGPLTIPQSVKTIGTAAFQGCSSLTGPLTIQQGVTKIGENAFSFCTSLKGALTIPQSVTEIGDRAFWNCTGLTGPLTISESVTKIGYGVFWDCTSLEGAVTIPEGVTTIGEGAFYRCGSLTGPLTIPQSVTEIGNNAFYDCSRLTGELTIPEGVITIGTSAFSGCRGLTGALKIPEGVTTIGTSAFSGCRGFTGPLTIPQSVTAIGNNAFYDCAGLSSATFASTGNTTLGTYLFLNCSELRYIDASSLPASTFSGIDVATMFRKASYTLLYLPEGATPSSSTDNVVIGNTCQSLKLYENTTWGGGEGANGYGQSGYEYGNAIIKPFTATSAVYIGKFLTDNGVYTLYLPYNIDLPTTIEAYSLSYYGSKTAVFTKHTSTLQAYTPYLLRRVAGSGTQMLNSTTMSNVTVAVAPPYLTNPNGGSAIDNATGTWKFLGTTNPISNADAEANRLYVLEANNTWKPVKSTVAGGHVRSLRAFLQAPAGYSGAPVAFMLDEEDTPTGLEEIEAEVKKENVDIYTVDGRFVGRNYESLPSGLYIIGGKKVYKF